MKRLKKFWSSDWSEVWCWVLKVCSIRGMTGARGAAV